MLWLAKLSIAVKACSTAPTRSDKQSMKINIRLRPASESPCPRRRRGRTGPAAHYLRKINPVDLVASMRERPALDGVIGVRSVLRGCSGGREGGVRYCGGRSALAFSVKRGVGLCEKFSG